MDDREELIRRRAHEIWESEGRPEGEDRRHWEQARHEIEDREGSLPAEEAQDTGTVVAPSTNPHGTAGRKADES